MAKIFYARLGEDWRKEQKYEFLDAAGHVGGVEWQELTPDARHTWLTEGMRDEFATFLPLGTKEAKASKSHDVESIFKTFSPGVNTARDSVVYDFDAAALLRKVEQFCEDYNAELYRYKAKPKAGKLDDFLRYDKIKWSEGLKSKLKGLREVEFDASNVRVGLYRPFTTNFLYYDSFLSDRPGAFDTVFPSSNASDENRVICIPSIGARTKYWCLCARFTPNLTITSVDINQCFPLYTYDEDGANRRENITDWALARFRAAYPGVDISKPDIFHYVYALLHHPAYRETYAANLKRELPRVPLVGVDVGAGLVPARRSPHEARAGTSPAPTESFREFVEAGERLAELHTNYERQKPYPLRHVENQNAEFSLRVERMTLAKDRRSLRYNDFLTLGGVPAEAFDYRLGNRSALEWIVDQYRVTTDKRSGITNDPNRADDPEYILRLVGQVVAVSVETVRIVRGLPELSAETARE